MANPFQIGATTVAGTGTSRVLTVANATAASDAILVSVSANNTTCIPSGVTDSKGNTYTLDKSFTTSSPTLYLYSSPGGTALTTSDTITVATNAVSGNVEIYAVDVPGSGGIDQIATIATGTSTTPSVSVTPTANNETIVAFFVDANAGGSPTINSPGTSLGINQTGSNAYQSAVYEVLTGGSGSAQTLTETITSAAWRAGMYSVKAGTSVSLALTVAQETIAAPAPTLSESLALPVAQETVAAPAPTAGLSLGLAVARETVSAPAPTASVGAVSLALPVAQETVNAPAPTASITVGVTLPVAQETVAAPAPTVAVGPVSVALPVAGVTISAPAPTVPGIQVYFGIGGIVH